MLAIEADTDANADIVLHTLSRFLVVGVNIILWSRAAVSLALDDEAATAGGDQLLEDIVRTRGRPA